MAARIVNSNPDAYEALVVDGGMPASAKQILTGVTAEQLVNGPIKSQPHAEAMLAALWLWHDGLDECHRIVQNSPAGEAGRTFSFWHAIVHRREGDFSNSKYWYARALNHPVMASLAGGAATVVNRAPADKGLLRIVANGWNPNALVDLAEEVSNNSADARRPIAIELQQMEWRTLWEYCAREA